MKLTRISFYVAHGRTLALCAVCALAACAQPVRPPSTQTIVYAQNTETKIRVFVQGQGPVVVLLPSQARGPADFDAMTRLLVESGHRVIRPEPRGFGQSVGKIEGITLKDLAVDVAAAIEKVGGGPAVLVGAAYGNRVARMLATDRPELVRGVVLVAAGGKFAPAPDVVPTLRIAQNPSLPMPQRLAAARAVLFGPNSKLSDADMRLDEVSAATLTAQTQTPNVPIDVWWTGGKAPMLVLQGLQDVIAPPENGRSLQRGDPARITLVEFEGVGHSMPLERPDLVATEIAKWVKTLP